MNDSNSARILWAALVLGVCSCSGDLGDKSPVDTQTTSSSFDDTETKTETGGQAETDPDSRSTDLEDTGTQTEDDTGTDAGSDSVVETDPGRVGTDVAGTETDFETQPDTGTDTEGDTSSDADTNEDSDTGPEIMRCNGHAALCGRPFNSVLFPMSHNSFSAAEYGFTLFNANHDTGLAAQLEAGVRGFMLDVHEFSGQTMFCHGTCLLGSLPHSAGLKVFADFLENNPHDVIAFVYEEYIDKADLARDLDSAGLLDFVYTHTSGRPWPTLGEMIDSGTRLLVTSEKGAGPEPWLHATYDLMWDTNYSHKSTDDFDCEVLRGSKDNDLFLINHWVNNFLDLPDKQAANQSNSKDMLLGRLERCHGETGQFPNFIAVDFWERGDLISAVDSFNGI